MPTSNSHSSLLTNVLLIIIAALLLVQVIQTGMNQGSNGGVSITTDSSPSSSQVETPNTSPQMMNKEMFFYALKAFPAGCKGRVNLAECNSPQAEAVKQEILKMSEGRSVRQTFDAMISKWGENILTDEARTIRKNRKVRDSQ